MKVLLIFILLLFLEIALVILIDFIQGLGTSEAIQAFIKIKQKVTGEEVILTVFFFLPLIISKVSNTLNRSNNSKN